MAKYRYLFTDLLTGVVNIELPVYGVSFSRKLNKAGNCTCSFALDSEGFDNAHVIEATIPGRTGFWIERNDKLIWGGILWSRTYQSQAKTLSWTGQTFESFLYRQYIETSQTFSSTDQRNILRGLINYMQAKSYANIGIVVPGAFSNNIVRSVNFYDYEVWSVGSAVENLIGYADGFDYTLEPAYDTSGDPKIYLITDDVLGQPDTVTGMALDYPGNVKNYWYPENATEGTVTMLGVGGGEGSAMLRSKSVLQARLDAGYPDLQSVYTNKDVQVLDTLGSQTQQHLNQKAIPVTVPTIELHPSVRPTYGDFSLGDYAILHIEDARFPDGQDVSVRVVGFNGVPSESDNAEQLSLIVAGQE